MFRFIQSHRTRQPVGITCLLACLVVASITPTVALADAALEDYNLAVGLYKQSRWANAADRFRVFLKTYDKHEKVAFARLYLGLTLINMDDYKTAREELRLFVKDHPQNPNLPQARYRVAECSYLLEDLPAARTELEAYLKDFPKDPFQEHALPYLGDAQLRLSDPAAALATFEQAIERFPKGTLVDDAKFGRARALETLKRVDEAANQYQELAAQKDGSRAADAQFHLGALAFDRKNFPDAAAAYVALTTSFPESRFRPVAHLNAGYAYYQSGNFAAAAGQFEAAAAEKSQRATAEYWRGLSLKSMTQYAKAVEALEAAAAVVGNQPLAESIMFQQAVCERHLGKNVEARQHFETVLRRWPTGEFADDSLHAMAELAFDGGDLAMTESLLSRFAKEFPGSSLQSNSELLAGRLELSRAAIAARDQKPATDVAAYYDAAARRFESVLADNAATIAKGQSRYYLAFTRQLQGQHTQALQIVAPLIDEVRAQGARSDLADALVLQADSLMAEKKYEDAEKAAGEYLHLLPQGRQAARALAI